MIKGSKHSSETKEKIRRSLIGTKASNETREALSRSHKGKKHSEETKRKISLALKGNNHPNYGKKLTDEQKKKLSDFHKNKKLSIKTKIKISDTLKGRNNGYTIKDIPLYDSYAKKLTIEEKPLRDKLDRKILTVICTNCKTRFIPSLKSVQERVRCLNGTQNGESRLYCSDECKKTCSIFRKQTLIGHDSKNNDYTSNQFSQFREFVLKRDKYKCQYCEGLATHVHHERPQKLEPFFSLDPDLAWSVCKECHYKYGHREECSTGNLSHIKCKNEEIK